MKKIIIAFMAGAALGILFAPDKGSNTRRKIADNFDELKESLRDEFNELFPPPAEMFNEEAAV